MRAVRRPGSLVPALLLAAFGAAFGARAIGSAVPAFDDHPGQLYRLWHLLHRGPAPWAWNPDWWAGYPELQFYPPGFFYLGLALHLLSLGALDVEAIYVVLVWVTWLAPGLTTYLLLSRVLGGGWPALPGAFVALTLAAGVHSGVEGGVHVGMLPARLAWALLPLLALTLLGWLEAERPSPHPLAVPLLAFIAITHPAHLPAAVALVALAAWAAPGGRRRRLAEVTLMLGPAALLTAFWTLPLLARLEHGRALAWWQPALLQAPWTHPLLVALGVAAALALPLGRTPTAWVLSRWPWTVILVVAVDALVVEQLGVRWLPADRLADSAWQALIVAASLNARRLAAVRAWPALAALALVLALGWPARTLVLWPRALDWPGLPATVRGLRLQALWDALAQAPPGRVLFVRSAVPLVYGTEWWRPHTHVTALTPLRAGRAIINGTFTHPSPVAALLYRGSAGPGPITRLVEQRDGRSLFGQPLATLDPGILERHAERLGVSVVVALDEDLPALATLNDSPTFRRRPPVGPFVLWERRQAAIAPEPAGPRRWTVAIEGQAGEWVPARTTYYPLWQARRGGVPLETRRGPAWDLEVRLAGRPGPVELIYPVGDPLGWAGLALSAGALLVWAARGRWTRLSRGR